MGAAETTTRRTRRDRFLDVAARRTRRILTDIQRLSNCANRSAYEYSEMDVLKIFAAIESELAIARKRFERKSERKGVDFSLE